MLYSLWSLHFPEGLIIMWQNLELLNWSVELTVCQVSEMEVYSHLFVCLLVYFPLSPLECFVQSHRSEQYQWVWTMSKYSLGSRSGLEISLVYIVWSVLKQELSDIWHLFCLIVDGKRWPLLHVWEAQVESDRIKSSRMQITSLSLLSIPQG